MCLGTDTDGEISIRREYYTWPNLFSFKDPFVSIVKSILWRDHQGLSRQWRFSITNAHRFPLCYAKGWEKAIRPTEGPDLFSLGFIYWRNYVIVQHSTHAILLLGNYDVPPPPASQHNHSYCADFPQADCCLLAIRQRRRQNFMPRSKRQKIQKTHLLMSTIVREYNLSWGLAPDHLVTLGFHWNFSSLPEHANLTSPSTLHSY